MGGMPVRKDRVMRDLTEYAVQYAHKGLSVRQIAINKLNTSSKHFSHKDFNG